MSTSINFSSVPSTRKYKNWKRDILPEIIKQEQIHRSQGIPATLRGLLYIFESMEILAKKDYTNLAKHLVKWRENDSISGDWIVDKSRQIINIVDYEYEGRCLLKVFDERVQTRSPYGVLLIINY